MNLYPDTSSHKPKHECNTISCNAYQVALYLSSIRSARSASPCASHSFFNSESPLRSSFELPTSDTLPLPIMTATSYSLIDYIRWATSMILRPKNSSLIMR